VHSALKVAELGQEIKQRPLQPWEAEQKHSGQVVTVCARNQDLLLLDVMRIVRKDRFILGSFPDVVTDFGCTASNDQEKELKKIKSKRH
jgi:hypothetical protein